MRTKRWFLCLITVLLTALLAAGAAADGGSTDVVPVQVNVTVELESARNMLKDINEFRTGSEAWYWNEDNTTKTNCSGLKTLTYDYALEQAAIQRAVEVALHFDHQRPDNTKCYTAFPDGYTFRGENIAAGYTTAADAFIGWREDGEKYSGQGHRRNMLNERFTCIGIGHVICNGYHYWTHALGGRSTPNTASSSSRAGAQTFTVNVSPALVNTLTAENVTLEVDSGNDYPQILFNTTETWPSSMLFTYIPSGAAPAWTAAKPSLLKLENDSITGLQVGKTTLTTQVFGQDVTADIEVAPHDFTAAEVKIKNADATYTGKPIEPEVQVYYQGNQLEQDIDYTLAYSNNVGATDAAKVTLTGIGKYLGTKEETYSIAKARLTATASDLDIVYGESPVFTDVTCAGFVNGETEAVLGGDLTFECSYVQYGDVGSCQIVPAGLTSDNYEISFLPGTLTVSPKEIGLRWSGETLTYNGAEQAPAAEAVGLVNWDSVAVVVTGATNVGENLTAAATGLTGQKALNYKLPAENTTTFRIVKADWTVSAPIASSDLVCTGEALPLLSTEGTANGGQVLYAVTTENERPVESVFTAAIPTTTEAGIYYVWYMVKGDENHLDYTSAAPIAVTILSSAEQAAEAQPGQQETQPAEPAPQSEQQDPQSQQSGQPGQQETQQTETSPESEQPGSQAEQQEAQPEQQTETQPEPVAPITAVAQNGVSFKLNESSSTAAVTGGEDRNITSLTIPDKVEVNGKVYKVTEIKDNAFKKYAKLKKVTIGKNIKTIGKNAFNGCKKLKTITFKGTSLKKIGKSAFKSIYKKATFKCPKKKLDAYETLCRKAGAPKKAKFK